MNTHPFLLHYLFSILSLTCVRQSALGVDIFPNIVIDRISKVSVQDKLKNENINNIRSIFTSTQKSSVVQNAKTSSQTSKQTAFQSSHNINLPAKKNYSEILISLITDSIFALIIGGIVFVILGFYFSD